MKKISLLTVILFLINNSIFSQVSIDQSDIDDGKSIIEAYLSPFGNSLGASLNNGWYNTAKPHKLGGFDITFTINTVIIPNTAREFKLSDFVSSTSNFSSNEEMLPTIFFGETSTSSGEISNKINYNGSMIELPYGYSWKIIPLPMFQAGVGLIKGTEIDLRYIPEQSLLSKINIGLFGLGIKHDLLQWIPLAQTLPFSMSFQAGYTNLKSILELPYGLPIDLNTQATTFNLLVSKKLLMFTGYAGIGYNSSRTTITLPAGNYANQENTIFDIEQITQLSFESKNSLRANIGLRFQITILALQANYTFSDYPAVTIGAGISIR